MKVQRLRFRYRLTAAAASRSQRELVAVWEGAVKAAGLSLAYSEGKRPAPQMSIGALLPLAVTSDCELLDLFLSERVEPTDARVALAAALPDGIELGGVEEVGVSAPSLQSRVRWAEYEVEVPAGASSAADVQCAIDAMLAANSLPLEYRRETKVRRYDLRPLVLSLRLAGARYDCLVLAMRLRAEPEMTGRADQVIQALGLPPPRRIHRRRLFLEEIQAAVMAHRRLGEPEDD